MFGLVGSHDSAVTTRPVPPLDLQVPETLATATFANG
jgi:hypothetical protein